MTQYVCVTGDTPLHIAARCGRADVVKALSTTLSKPEVHHPYFRVPYKSLPQDNVQSYNHDGRTPIHLAVQETGSPEHRETIKALVRYSRADIDYRVFTMLLSVVIIRVQSVLCVNTFMSLFVCVVFCFITANG